MRLASTRQLGREALSAALFHLAMLPVQAQSVADRHIAGFKPLSPPGSMSTHPLEVFFPKTDSGRVLLCATWRRTLYTHSTYTLRTVWITQYRA